MREGGQELSYVWEMTHSALVGSLGQRERGTSSHLEKMKMGNSTFLLPHMHLPLIIVELCTTL